MKYLTILLLICNLSFSQGLEKITTDEPIRTNYVEVNGEFLASSEIREDSAELTFRAKGGSVISIGMKISAFNQIGSVVLSYDNQDKDFYQMEVSGSILQIRFIEKYGYVQPHISVLLPNGIAKFPELNKNQFKKLFKG